MKSHSISGRIAWEERTVRAPLALAVFALVVSALCPPVVAQERQGPKPATALGRGLTERVTTADGVTDPEPPATTTKGVLYAWTFDGDLLWYRHLGRTDGTFRWATPRGGKVGNGWAFREVLPGD